MADAIVPAAAAVVQQQKSEAEAIVVETPATELLTTDDEEDVKGSEPIENVHPPKNTNINSNLNFQKKGPVVKLVEWL